MKDKKRDIHKSAVALKYKPPEDSAPKVTAKGRGVIAERIIEEALKHDIPLKEDPDLIQILSLLDIGEDIPPSVYKVVAEILAFVYSLNNRFEEVQGQDSR